MMRRPARPVFPGILRWLYLTAPVVVVILVLFTEARDSRPATRATRPAMGTSVTITVLHRSERRARMALEAAYDAIERAEAALSAWRDSSEVSRLNRDRTIVAGSDLQRVLTAARHYYELSSGAFDITVKPVLDVYRAIFADEDRAPTPAERDAARQAVGFEHLTVTGNEVFLSGEAAIDLGGLAKGYIIDRAVAALRRSGIHDGLVNAGGDIRAFGSNNGEPWRIALQNPRDRTDYLAVIALTDYAITTSGDYERYFDPEREYHHIIDPRTGRSATALISATIIAGRAVDADALSTSVFVLGPEEGLALVERLAGVEALLITRGREIRVSSGLDDYLTGSLRVPDGNPELSPEL